MDSLTPCNPLRLQTYYVTREVFELRLNLEFAEENEINFELLW